MTRSQENAVDELALQFGRVQVDAGYADGAVRVIAPNGARFIVAEGGGVREAGVSFSVDWTC